MIKSTVKYLNAKSNNTYLKTKDPDHVLPPFPLQHQEWLPPT